MLKRVEVERKAARERAPILHQSMVESSALERAKTLDHVTSIHVQVKNRCESVTQIFFRLHLLCILLEKPAVTRILHGVKEIRNVVY